MNQNLAMDVQRGTQTLHLGLTARIPEKDDGGDILSEIGLGPEGPSIVGRVKPGTPADKAGIKTGAEIVAVNGIQAQSANAVGLTTVLQSSQNRPLPIPIHRK